LARPFAVEDDEHMFPPGLITAIDHVGIAVPDIDEAIAFYEDSFGLRLVHREVNADQGVQEAMLAAGDSDTVVQLLSPLGPESPIAAFLQRKGPGVQQVAYRVTSIDEAMAAVRRQGMRLVYDEPRRGTSDSRVNFVHPKDAGGVLVELVEPASERAPAPDGGDSAHGPSDGAAS
jgi:methylmalonyl-CoA/ethylmalonyl-CoA epimerase